MDLLFEFDEMGNITKYTGTETEADFPTQCRKTGSDNHFNNDFTKLKKIKIPEGAEIIGYCAFANCVNLEYIQLPSSLKYIDSSAFIGCTNLKEIVIPEKIKIIAEIESPNTLCGEYPHPLQRL